MNHLKKFSIFENIESDNQSKSDEDNFSLIDVKLYSQNNEKFFELADGGPFDDNKNATDVYDFTIKLI